MWAVEDRVEHGALAFEEIEHPRIDLVDPPRAAHTAANHGLVRTDGQLQAKRLEQRHARRSTRKQLNVPGICQIWDVPNQRSISVEQGGAR